MDDGEFSDKLECIAKSLWGRGMKSINELNSISIEEIFNKLEIGINGIKKWKIIFKNKRNQKTRMGLYLLCMVYKTH